MTDNTFNAVPLELRFKRDEDSDLPLTPYLAAEDDGTTRALTALDDDDREMLDWCEKLFLDGGFRQFTQVAWALNAIKESELYRETHPSFAAYCEETLGLPHINNGSAGHSILVPKTGASRIQERYGGAGWMTGPIHRAAALVKKQAKKKARMKTVTLAPTIKFM